MLTEKYGFPEPRTTVNNDVQFIDNILHSLNQRSSVGTIYPDFSKAFDQVTDQLLRKLQTRLLRKQPKLCNVIAKSLLGWCEAYLYGRSSVVNEESSDPFGVSSGVP